MTSRPQSWAAGYGEVEFNLAYHDYHPTSTRSRNSLNDLERRPMLEQDAVASMRPVHVVEEPSVASSSHFRFSQSSNAIPRDSDSQDQAVDLSQGKLHDTRPSMTPSIPSSSRIVPLSPLNPASRWDHTSPSRSPFTRSNSYSSAHITRLPSEESRVLAGGSPPSSSIIPATSRASMILYRRAEPPSSALRPPSLLPGTRPSSMISMSGDSFISLSSDSKYPLGERGLVAYAYDPSMDEYDATDDEDILHDPNGKMAKLRDRSMSWRWLKNFAALLILVVALLCLFILYPVYVFYSDDGRNAMIVGNTRINSTGQAEPLSFDP